VLPKSGGGGLVVGIDAACHHEYAADFVAAVGEGHGGAVDAGAGGIDVVDEEYTLRRALFRDGEPAAGGAVEPEIAVTSAQQGPHRHLQCSRPVRLPESRGTGASPAQAASLSADPINAGSPTAARNSAPSRKPMPGMLVITSASGWRRNRSSMSASVVLMRSSRAITSCANWATSPAATSSPGSRTVWALAAVTAAAAIVAALRIPASCQYPGQPRNAALPNGFRTLVARQQHHPTAVLGQLGEPLQGRTHRNELLAQPVDRTGAIGDQISPMGT
jgi:hypothetical protein